MIYSCDWCAAATDLVENDGQFGFRHGAECVLPHGKHESLEDIITRADAMMYAEKAAKKLAA